MTTAHSPLSVLFAQASQIAKTIKAVERGEYTDARIDRARSKDSVKFAVAMDDKLVTVEIPWATIRETSETAMQAYILKLMQKSRNH